MSERLFDDYTQRLINILLLPPGSERHPMIGPDLIESSRFATRTNTTPMHDERTKLVEMWNLTELSA